MIDTKKPIRFYDDTGRGDSIIMDAVLYENEDVCLSMSGTEIILFSKKSCKVLSSNYAFYYAENF